MAVEIRRLNGHGGAALLEPALESSWVPAEGVLWIRSLLTQAAEDIARLGLPEVVAENLLEPDAAPLHEHEGEWTTLILGPLPTTDPQSPQTVRVACRADLVFMVVPDACNTWHPVRPLSDDAGWPDETGDLLVLLGENLTDCLVEELDEREDRLNLLQERVGHGRVETTRADLTDARRELLHLRRRFTQQRSALSRLRSTPVRWLRDKQRQRLSGATDDLAYALEEMDIARLQALMIDDGLNGRQTDQINQRTYFLAIVACLYAPLSLLAGLWGANVGGIPFASQEFGFLWLLLGLMVVGAVQVLLLRRLKWI